jgi:hypothetical protein
MQKEIRATVRKSLVGAGLAGAIVLTLVTGAPAQPPPQAQKDVVVVNTEANPVPVTGAVAVSGNVAVSGAVSAFQGGLWTMGIDPARNKVAIAGSDPFVYDSNLGIVNDGQTVDLGPFDLETASKLRIIARAVNGNVRFRILANTTLPIVLDDFTLESEGEGNVYKSVVYDVTPPSITVRLTETGPGGSNYQVVLIAR